MLAGGILKPCSDASRPEDFGSKKRISPPPDRLAKLMAVLTIAFCWAHAVGVWLAQQTPLKIKKHGRLAQSLFRSGFDHLRNIITNIAHKLHEFHEVIHCLEGPNNRGDQRQEHQILLLAA